jgi:hypothetical protein
MLLLPPAIFIFHKFGLIAILAIFWQKACIFFYIYPQHGNHWQKTI